MGHGRLRIDERELRVADDLVACDRDEVASGRSPGPACHLVREPVLERLDLVLLVPGDVRRGLERDLVDPADQLGAVGPGRDRDPLPAARPRGASILVRSRLTRSSRPISVKPRLRTKLSPSGSESSTQTSSDVLIPRCGVVGDRLVQRRADAAAALCLQHPGVRVGLRALGEKAGASPAPSGRPPSHATHKTHLLRPATPSERISARPRRSCG